jgi:hypothetical protein
MREPKRNFVTFKSIIEIAPLLIRTLQKFKYSYYAQKTSNNYALLFALHINTNYFVLIINTLYITGSVHVGFVVAKVALGQVFHRVLRFSPINFIPPVLNYLEKRKKTNHLHHRLHNKPYGCGVSVASAAGPFTPPPK